MTFSGDVDVRDGFGAALAELAESDSRVVALSADLTNSVRFGDFGKNHPERFFQMGISESDMMGTAAGLALAGKIPFPATFAVFASSLAHQAIRLSIAYNKANVKIVASHGGVTVGGDGATHQAIEDIALMRVIPGMNVIVPCDANQAYVATKAAAALEGPVYLRFARSVNSVIEGSERKFEIGKAQILREGSDVAIIATGIMVGIAMDAAVVLEGRGISARVINMHTIKPLDQESIIEAAKDCGAIVTAEEHSVLGGLGGSVCEVLGKNLPVPVEMVGVQDSFGESADPREMLDKFGLNTAGIVEAVDSVLSR